ncbi:MAG TPA: hypothetical protein EYP49_00740 [Anaerolineae bacterium]|nr:hypothetical protein [Anaerolineae bacterium]HIP97490.1 hypothetical protein [Anaerolineae bacterium]
MTTAPVTGRTRDLVIAIDRLVLAFSRHWLLVVNVTDGPGPGRTGPGAVPFLRPELPPITPAGFADSRQQLETRLTGARVLSREEGEKTRRTAPHRGKMRGSEGYKP